MPDTIPFTLSIVGAEGLPAADTQVTYTFRRLDGEQRGDPISEPLRGIRVFDLDGSHSNSTLSCSISCDHFRDINTGHFFVNLGMPIAKSVVALREPDEWRPVFRPLADLRGPTFDRLLQVIAASDMVDVKNGPWLGQLSTAFDSLKGDQQEQAKMALLNLYSMLASELNPIKPYADKTWFSFVQKVVRIDQERFVSVVDSVVYDSVQRILARQDYFSGLGFFPELSPGMHVENFPPRYGITGRGDIISIKKRCEEGNLQLTVARSTAGGESVYLLDCDMDEHANGILHFFDAFLVHPLAGGTNPVDMHEILMLADSATQMASVAGIDLGYDLAPK